MYIAQEEERLLFALGRLKPENARIEYQPGHFQRYPGIADELKAIGGSEGTHFSTEPRHERTSCRSDAGAGYEIKI